MHRFLFFHIYSDLSLKDFEDISNDKAISSILYNFSVSPLIYKTLSLSFKLSLWSYQSSSPPPLPLLFLLLFLNCLYYFILSSFYSLLLFRFLIYSYSFFLTFFFHTNRFSILLTSFYFLILFRLLIYRCPSRLSFFFI